MSQRISYEVNNQGTMTIEQERHDGPVDVIVWDAPVNGCRGVRHGDVINPGDMVMLMNYYHYQKEHGAPIFGLDVSVINDIRALLQMIRIDVLPEPVRSLAENLKRKI